MDRLIEKGRTKPDLKCATKSTRKPKKMIVDRALLLPLFHEQTYRFARPEVQDFDVIFSTQSVPYKNLWLRK